MSATSPVNVIKYCPKCGSESFPYMDDNSFKCEVCSFHLYINASAAVAAIILNDRGDILLTRRAVAPQKGMLDLPGGFVDVMESAERALYREIKEELDLKIEEMKYFMSLPNEYVFGGLSVFTIDLAYICTVKTFEGIVAKDDITGFEFINPKKICFEEICSGSIKSIVQEFIKTIET